MRARVWVALVVLMMVLAGSAGAALDDLPSYRPDGNADRTSIPAVYRWDLAALYPSDEAWSEALTRARKGVDELAAYHGRLHDAEALAAKEKMKMATPKKRFQ